ncbi:unnamed protein product [Leptidea sinapis]|uniref:Uncharacterized protein n=1 Tax=Leptidea sinapis TaxID=189913 RepID=A0A5E4RA19_9NEOP|nr:unnamed protein product [Leptidea sinapis]
MQRWKALGSRRPSLSSVQSSSSSIRSYSAKRWERDREQRERRQMSIRLAQLHDKMSAGREIPKHAPTPSPRSPNNSTDGLLPSVCEIREVDMLYGMLLSMVIGLARGNKYTNDDYHVPGTQQRQAIIRYRKL